ncbi:helix-turn-helix domain-containing protein [Candidatus Bathyarchaeota archaeon]|nr:helix-turn-helix domain-containing protein [Candidatus Bathyarchaeota archaeon]
MKRIELLNEVENSLKKANYEFSERCEVRPSCFDIAARKGRGFILIKVFTNLGSVPVSYANDMHLIADHLMCLPFMVGMSTTKSYMEDDAVYTRHGILAITPLTLLNILLRKQFPLVEAKPGGFYVQLNGEAIRKRREELGLSLGDLAAMIGVSRRAVYGYECNLARASIHVALKIEAALGIPVVRHINPFRREKPKVGTLCDLNVENKFLRKVLRKLAKFGFSIAVTKKAPFDFIAVNSDGTKIIGGAAERNEKKVENRIKETNSVAKVAKLPRIFIVEEKIENDKVIHWNEFAKIKKPNDLYETLSL